MTSNFFDSLEDILSSLQHSDQGIRRSGEIHYHQFQNSADYVAVVTKFAADSNKPMHFRQLVILLLNQQIGKEWRSFSHESKGKLVQFTFSGIGDQINVLRTAYMHMLSKIFSRSSEAETNEILIYLSGQLSMPDLFVVTSSLRCLCTIADEADYSSLIEIIRLCYGKIHQIIMSADKSNMQLLRYSSKLMRLCIQKFSAARMACGLEEAAIRVIENFLPVWTKLVTQMLSAIQDISDITSKLGIILELLRSIAIALEAFPDECGEAFSESMRVSWSLLCLIRDDAHAPSADTSAITRGFTAISESGYTSDGDRIDLQALVVQLFELLTIGLSTSSAEAKSLLGGDLDHLVCILAERMVLSEEQLQQWEHDGNEFVASEQEEFSEFSVRHSGAELLTQICRGGKERAFKVLFLPKILDDLRVFSMFSSHPTSSVSVAALDGRAILQAESMMWCVGCLGSAYMKHVRIESKYRSRTRQSAEDSFNAGSEEEEAPKGKEAAAIHVINLVSREEVSRVVAMFAHTFLLDPLKGQNAPHPAHAVLRGRAAWLLSTYIQLFDTTFIETVCEACVRSMDPTQPLSVRLQSCRTLSLILSKTAHTQNASNSTDSSSAPLGLFSASGRCQTFCLAVIECTLHLLPSLTHSTLHYSLELASVAVKKFLTHVTPSEDSAGRSDAVWGAAVRVVQAALKVLSAYCTDPFLLDVCKDVFRALSRASVPCLVAVYEHCVPQLQRWLHVQPGAGDNGDSETMKKTLSGSSTPPSLVDVSMEILSGACTSPTLPFMHSHSSGHALSEVVVSGLIILVSSLRAESHPCRREGLQAINIVFSHYEGRVQDLFTPHSAQTATPQTLSLSIADLILQTIRGCETDPGVFGDSSGPAAGLLCHLLINFKTVLDGFVVNSLLSAALHCLRDSTSTYVKYSLLMGLIHLFARDAALLAAPSSPLLGLLPPVLGSLTKPVSALGFVLDEWCLLHVHLTSKYSGTISTLGLLELVKIFHLHASNHPHALRVLQLALSTLPRILLDEEGDEELEEGPGNENVKEDRDDDSENSHGDEWESDEDYNDDEDGQYDDMDAMTGEEGGSKQHSPFAPAEMYLSDMVGSRGTRGDDENDQDFLVLNVSSYLVYSPPSADPLAAVDLQGAIIAVLMGLKSGDSRGMYPPWMNALSGKDQHLVQALVESR